MKKHLNKNYFDEYRIYVWKCPHCGMEVYQSHDKEQRVGIECVGINKSHKLFVFTPPK